MTDPFDDGFEQRLREALRAEADSVRPSPEALDLIRTRTAQRRLSPWAALTWLRPAAAVAAAALIGGSVLLGTPQIRDQVFSGGWDSASDSRGTPHDGQGLSDTTSGTPSVPPDGPTPGTEPVAPRPPAPSPSPSGPDGDTDHRGPSVPCASEDEAPTATAREGESKRQSCPASDDPSPTPAPTTPAPAPEPEPDPDGEDPGEGGASPPPETPEPSAPAIPLPPSPAGSALE
ncbi:hypothetical protein ACQEU5_02795 [Marinactinospora thermotolerans]|uniref:hypothetical protein n=1 Tax=Marinactinospora thermotolerans TaxID=531310 RepID=UPI003D9047E2